MAHVSKGLYQGKILPTISRMAAYEPSDRIGPVRVLVVEDDRTLGPLVRMVLRQFTDKVVLAVSGRDALDCAEGSFDAIACDISLPDMSGLELIAKLRGLHPSAGIVAVTGLVDVDVAVQSMKAGADDFVAKPFDPEILWHVLNKAIDLRKQRIEASQAQVYKQLAYTDALTGVPNRRYIDEYLDAAVKHARETNGRLCVGYVDIDNFKLFNDFVGHEQGDLVLKAIAESLRGIIQPPDVFARFGGDEFVVVFPGSGEQHAQVIFDAVRALVDRIEVSNGHKITLPTRVSCGIAAFTGTEAPRDLVAAAEDRMYLDKSLAPAIVASMNTPHTRPDTMVKVTNLKALRSLVKAIDRRDSYTRVHSDHATHIALRVAKELGLDEDASNAIMIAGPIHDLGKIVVPDEILRKPGPLTLDERRQMEEHPIVGGAITAAVTDHDAVVNLVRHHHERFDGEGYPGRLRRNEVPLATRLFSIADAYSAMTTDRPYRRGLTEEQTIEQLTQGAGSQFDPDLVPVFVKALEARPQQRQTAA